jgi:hypothetical protein
MMTHFTEGNISYKFSINKLLIIWVDFSHRGSIRLALTIARLYRYLIVVCSILVDLLLLMLVFKTLVHKTFQRVDIIFSILEPSIVMSAAINLMVLFEWCIGSGIM